MTKRFCGDVDIDIFWRDFEGGRWKCRVRSAGVSANAVVPYEHVPNRHLGVNHPRVYDEVAQAALAQATVGYGEDCRKIADAAASGIVNGAYRILRKRASEPALSSLVPRLDAVPSVGKILDEAQS
jgi:hypothetical protein